MDDAIMISSDEESGPESLNPNTMKIDDNLMDKIYQEERRKLQLESENDSRRHAHDLSDSDSSENVGVSLGKKSEPQKGKRQRKKLSEEAIQQKKEKEERKKALNEERQRKKEEEAKRKAEKKAAAEVLKKMKPGECMKSVTVVFDANLLSCPFSGALLAAVQSSGAGTDFRSQSTPYSITWTQESIDGVRSNQNHVVIIWTADMMVQTIVRGALESDVKEIKKLHPNYTILLVILGMESYFSQQKSQKTKAMKSQIAGGKNPESNSLPVITRVQLEESLTEIQLLCDCCHRLLETAEDIGLLVSQFTKAIAETPYKKMKFDKTQKDLEWFAAGDSKDCVRIDKNGNGFSRLWQKQICQFNLVGLDLADAVINQYKSPQALVSAYEKCASSKEAELLLQDLPVRRGVGPLTTSRRVGPELSKKLFLFFTGDDENTTFSQESK